jgi:putative heme iron utilization protein
VSKIEHAARKVWEVLKLWGDENIGTTADEIVNNDSPIPEGWDALGAPYNVAPRNTLTMGCHHGR